MRWTARKKRTEALWVDGLKMVIHANAYRHSTSHSWYDLERWYVVLNGEIIWDFPAPFVVWTVKGETQTRLPSLPYYGGSDCNQAQVMDAYSDRPLVDIFEPIEKDHWELGDILRAADRRLGKARLLAWGKDLAPENPARKVLEARFKVNP